MATGNKRKKIILVSWKKFNLLALLNKRLNWSIAQFVRLLIFFFRTIFVQSVCSPLVRRVLADVKQMNVNLLRPIYNPIINCNSAGQTTAERKRN